MPPKRKINRDEDDDYIYRDDDEDYVDTKVGRGGGRKSGSTVGPGRGVVGRGVSSSTIDSTFSSTLMTDDSDGYGLFQDLSTSLTLKKDHDKRPIWITKNNIIILEAFSKYYTQAYDFLIDISEPISRPTYFHTYKLTEDSLYAAVAVARSTDSIIKYLGILCKTEIPSEVIHFIRSCTATFGKAKLVLKNNVYYVESQFPDVLRELLKNPVIRNARVAEPAATTTASVAAPLTTGNIGASVSSYSLAAASSSSSGNMVGDGGAVSSGIAEVVNEDGFLESSAPKEYRRDRDLQLIDEDIDEEEEEVDTDALVNGIVQHQSVKTVSFMIDQNQVHVSSSMKKHQICADSYSFTLYLSCCV